MEAEADPVAVVGQVVVRVVGRVVGQVVGQVVVQVAGQETGLVVTEEGHHLTGFPRIQATPSSNMTIMTKSGSMKLKNDEILTL